MNDLKYGKLVEMVHLLIASSYSGRDNLVMVDATAGNGGDTLFLSNIAATTGKVYAFDIQQFAISNTEKLMTKNAKYSNYKLILDSHANIDNYILDAGIDVAVFNLGYLPTSDKHIKTDYESTIAAINCVLSKLNNDSGRIFITAYLGHDNGEEAKKVLEYIASLDRRKYNVIQIKLLNKNNTPPEIYIIEK